ncbi:MAG: type II toxin-antitoxin system RelE/ParE family toxin [Clostridiales Family XIII bacterium]|jgi:mRNA interferase RelE/StbE|nr:type II toxin-antitoxin system RelE/ParE family toxin [Clostridiales Family XIII bacterium]
MIYSDQERTTINRSLAESGEKRIIRMNIVFSKQAVKSIHQADNITKKRIGTALTKLPNGDIARIEGLPGLFRLRIGGWRILFSFVNDDTIIIEKILPRGNAYSRF